MSTEKPWGKEKKWSALPGVAGKILCINKGHRTSLKYHPRKDEAFYILKGRVRFEFADEEWLHFKGVHMKEAILTEGESMCVQSSCVYRINALEGSEVIEIGSYGSDSEIVRIEDDYGRKVYKESLPNLQKTE